MSFIYVIHNYKLYIALENLKLYLSLMWRGLIFYFNDLAFLFAALPMYNIFLLNFWWGILIYFPSNKTLLIWFLINAKNSLSSCLSLPILFPLKIEENLWIFLFDLGETTHILLIAWLLFDSLFYFCIYFILFLIKRFD